MGRVINFAQEGTAVIQRVFIRIMPVHAVLRKEEVIYKLARTLYKGELLYVRRSEDGKSCDFTWVVKKVTHRGVSKPHWSGHGVIHSHDEDHTIRATFTTVSGESRMIELGSCVFNN